MLAKYAKILSFIFVFSIIIERARRRASCRRCCNQSLFRVRSAFRRRDNHISRAITCLCISIIPWRRSPGDPGQGTAYILLLCSALRTNQTRTPNRLPLRCREREREEARETGLQRTTLISLIELSTRDCCNYDYL